MKLPRQFGLLIGLFLFSNLASPQEEQPSAPPPSVASLKELPFESVTSPKVVGGPNYGDLQGAIHSFQVFHDGASEVRDWKWDDQPKTRGPRDTAVYNNAVNAVVYIVAETESPKNGKVPIVKGAGAILAPDDLILTNWHVTREAMLGHHPIMAYLKPAKGVMPIEAFAYAAHVEYYNDAKDMSLLRFDKHPPYKLAELRVAQMSSVVVGQDIHVIGHPRGETWSYSTGVISQVRVDYKTNFQDESGKQEQSFEADVLQLQTAISPGNSGGPVLNDNGEIIGLVSFTKKDAQNIDFAVAANEITGFLQRHNAKMGPQPKAKLSAQAEYSVAPISNGNHVVKAVYPDFTTYMVVDAQGRVNSVVADAGNGDVIEAWKSDGQVGSLNWRAKYADGKLAEAEGGNGQPIQFTMSKQ